MKVVLSDMQYENFNEYVKKALQQYLIQHDLALFHEYLCYPDHDILSDYDIKIRVKDIAYINTRMSHDERHKKILPESLYDYADIKIESHACNIEFGSHITPFFKQLYLHASPSQKAVIYHKLPIVHTLKELTMTMRHEPEILSEIILQSAGNYRKVLADERNINDLLNMWKKVFSQDQLEYTLYDLLLPYKKPLLSLALQINIRNIINTYIHDPVRLSKLIAVFPFANPHNIPQDIFKEDNTHCYRIMIDRRMLSQFVHLSQPSYYNDMQNHVVEVLTCQMYKKSLNSNMCKIWIMVRAKTVLCTLYYWKIAHIIKKH